MSEKVFSGVKSLFCSLSICAVVNYLVTFIYRPPAVYNILPMLPVVFLRAKDLRKKYSRPWQYVHFAVMLVISFLFYVTDRIQHMKIVFVGCLMTFVLAVWCVLCVEDKISFRRKNIGYLILFVVVCTLYGGLVWTHYNQKAAVAIDYIAQNDQPETGAADDIDALCYEIDRVLLGDKKNYRFWNLADRWYGRYASSCEAEYRELQELVKNPGRNKIRVLMNAISSLGE